MNKQDNQAVLMFHGIGTAEHPLEAGEDAYWIGWDFFDAVLGHCAALGPKSDMFTFDDGNASDLEAARRMRARGVSGHFFILVGRLGQAGYLSVDDVKELMSLGMEIGLHGRDHRDWRKVDDRTLHSEIDDARAELTTICNRPITTVAKGAGIWVCC